MRYLDYAATTPLCPAAMQAMQRVLSTNWGNPSSAHSMGRDAKQIVDMCHTAIADYCNVLPSEVIITGSGSESINLAMNSVAEASLKKNQQPGTIVSSPLEHKAVTECLHNKVQQGWKLIEVPLEENGTIDLNMLEATLQQTDDVALVTIQWVNSEVGIIQPIESIAALTQQYNVPFHCDASQGVPHLAWPNVMPDLVSFSPHKLYGPKGIGILIAKKSIEIYPLVYGGGQEFGHRSGTENTVAMAGTTAAISQLATELAERNKHDVQVQTYLHKAIARSKSLERTAPNSPCVASTTNILLQNSTAETAVMQCDLAGICISTGSACSSGAQESNPTVQALGLSRQQALRTIRMSTGVQTEVEDIDALLKVID